MHPDLLDLLKRGDPNELVALFDHIDESPRPLHYLLCWVEEHRPGVLSLYLDPDRTNKTPLALPLSKLTVKNESWLELYTYIQEDGTVNFSCPRVRPSGLAIRQVEEIVYDSLSDTNISPDP